MNNNIQQTSTSQSFQIQQQENIDGKMIGISPDRKDIERQIYQKLQSHNCLNIVKIINIYNNEIEIEDIPLTLDQFMRKRQELSFEFSSQEIKLIMAQIINGYQYLRSLGIIHRNLNPQTILVKQINGKSIIKISDFSVSSLLMNNSLRQSKAGTPAYWAPEIMLSPQNGYCDNCDIFSLGVILHQLCFQTRMPQDFKDEYELEQFFRKLQKQNFKCQTGIKIEKEIVDLIERMIVFEPQKRVSWDELARIPFFQLPYLILKDRYLIDFTRQLGSGMQGVIYLTIDLKEQTEFCAKVIQNTTYEGQQELKIYQKLKEFGNQENIIKVFDIFGIKNESYVLMEKCDENIQQYLKKQEIINNDEILEFLRQIICGYIDLQELKIIHRDLKPENLLIKYEDRKKIVKIIDFGVSKMNYTKNLASTVAGTPIYSAPEVLDVTDKGYTNKCDIYSLGVMLYQFIFKKPYYNAYTLEELKSFQKNLQNKPFKCPSQSTFNDLIEKMLLYDPQKRISWEELQIEVIIMSLKQNLKERESILQENISASILKYLDCVQIFTSKVEQELIKYFQTKPKKLTEAFYQASLLDCHQIFEKQHVSIDNQTFKQEVDYQKINDEKLLGYIDSLQTNIENITPLLNKDADYFFSTNEKQMFKDSETKKLTCHDLHQYFNAIYKKQRESYFDAPLKLKYYLEKMSNIFLDYQLQNIDKIIYLELADKVKVAQKEYLEAKKVF